MVVLASVAISVAPLTPTVMVGAAGARGSRRNQQSGLAVAACGDSRPGGSLHRGQTAHSDSEFTRWNVPDAVCADIDRQGKSLGAAQTNDPGREAILQSFVSGYRLVLWIAVALAVASSLSAAALISTRPANTQP